MIFEIAKRIETSKTPSEVASYLHSSLGKISKNVENTSDTKLSVSGIEMTFGSINRKDKGVITCEPAEGGVLAKAEIHYRPSFFFWILLIVLLFTYVLWLLPIAFYLYQKNTVRSAIENVLQKANEELRTSTSKSAQNSLSDELERLSALKERGILTQQEFDAQKAKLLA